MVQKKIEPTAGRSEADRTNTSTTTSTTTSTSTSAYKKRPYENAAFEGGGDVSVPEQVVSHSSAPSTRDPSLHSLTVTREQYCCCLRSSAREKRLFVAVGVLATIIIALLVVVGNLAGGKEVRSLL